MRVRAGTVVAAAAVLVVSGTTAVAMAGEEPGAASRGGGTWMSQTWPDRPFDGRERGPASGHGSQMMPGGPGHCDDTSVANEYRYLAEMVAHHREAVAAARQLRRSDRAEMRAFGRSIVASQTAQVQQMRAWLAEWYPNRSGQVDYEPMMRDLTALSGDRLDRVFLQDMVMHHMTAVMMSQQLLRHGLAEHPRVAALARTIRSEQRAEIHQMRRWLREWFGQDGHHGPGGGHLGGGHPMMRG